MKKTTKFIITTTDEHLTSHSGLALIGTLIENSGLRNGLRAVLPPKKSGAISSDDAVISMLGLLSLAKPDFAAVEQFRDDTYFRRCLGLKAIPSEETLRQRMDEIAKDAKDIRAALLAATVRLLHSHKPKLAPCFKEYLPIDGDVSPFDNSGTKKEGVGFTYKKLDGYAPMFAYLCGYLLNAELREGKQHCQKGTPDFLQETIVLARQITNRKLIVRLDAGNDHGENIRICRRNKVDFVIKRNLRREDIGDWLATAILRGKRSDPRPGKVVYIGDTVIRPNGQLKNYRVVFKVTERTIDRNGQALLLPEIDVATWWTSLGVRTASAEEVIAIYADHGTSEQYHSEIKTDMDLERLPSGKFATNGLILTMAVLTFNMLRLCGQTGMKNGFVPEKKVKRRRIRTVIQDMMYMAARVVDHARRVYIAISRCNPLREMWAQTYLAFTELG